MTTESPEAVAWATASGAAARDVLDAWRAGQAAEVPIGRLWDVLRVTTTLAFAAIERLQTADVPLGPVVEARPAAVIEFLLPPGTARSWPEDLLGTTCVARGTLRCPSPFVMIGTGRSQSGRRWLAPPAPVEVPYFRPVAPWTCDDALCEAVAAAIVHSVRPYLPQQRKAARAAI